MAKFSYSKIDTYSQCHYKYKLKYEDGNYVFCNSLATELGTLTHATEEAIAKAIQNNEKIDYITLKNNFLKKMIELEHKYSEDFNALDKSNRNYAEKCYLYLEQNIYNLETFMRANPDLEIVGIEQPFNFQFKDTNYNFNGFIDRVFRNKKTNELIIQDIKTYAIPVEDSKLKVPLQFVVYSMAANQLYPGMTYDNITCQYYLPFVDTGLTQSAGETGFMDSGIKKLDKLFNGIETKDWKPTATPLCAWCEYSCTNKNAPKESHLLCPYHSNWTKENKDLSVANKWEGADQDAIIVSIYKKEMGN